MNGYSSYHVLKSREVSGLDYQIEWRTGHSGLAVMAPHGGGIEPGTSELARSIAKGAHTFYHFEGLKRKNNGVLHMTSTRFDEPVALALAKASWKVITIHGCSDGDADLYLGGRDNRLQATCTRVLREKGFSVADHPVFRGLQKENLCNRGQAGMGLQIELSLPLRRRLFLRLDRWGRRFPSPLFHDLVEAFRLVLSVEAGKLHAARRLGA